MSDEFDALYSASGRTSIAPEYVLRALLLHAFYSERSKRQLVEQLDYNLLFRWLVGLGMVNAVWNHAVFSACFGWQEYLAAEIGRNNDTH